MTAMKSSTRADIMIDHKNGQLMSLKTLQKLDELAFELSRTLWSVTMADPLKKEELLSLAIDFVVIQVVLVRPFQLDSAG